MKKPKKPIEVSFIPATIEETKALGWDYVDLVFVTGDAYVDHPSFASAILGRWLLHHGFRVAILDQPDWRNCEAWRTFGRPRLAFGISAGAMDSMVNKYTPFRRIRSADAYSPNGEIGRRPDRAINVYSQRAREAYPGCKILIGGIEASLRRLAHYDHYSDKLRRSALLDSKADLLMYGMGELTFLEIMNRLDERQQSESSDPACPLIDQGTDLSYLTDLAGTAYRRGAKTAIPEGDDVVRLPSWEEVLESKEKFAEMTRIIYDNLNPYCAKTLVQTYGSEHVVVRPPQRPLTTDEMDAVYSLPFNRQPHPKYRGAEIPALTVIKNSIQVVRGCFGGCSFCSIAAHEGKIIQSRSPDNIVQEIRNLQKTTGFSGVVSDLGGPTANSYQMTCQRPDVQRNCRRTSCLYPKICPNLNTDHGPVINLMARARQIPGIKQVFVASGIRTDLAQLSPDYIRALSANHVGGYLKTAPEHVDDAVLNCMRKPSIESYQKFESMFKNVCKQCGKNQFLIPYFIAGHPGCDLKSMILLAERLRRDNLRPQQVQDFWPGPFDWATAMYYTEMDPATGKPLYVAKNERDRRMQRALMQYFLPENYFWVKEALTLAHRTDLIGTGPNCLIGPNPPREAIKKKEGKSTDSRNRKTAGHGKNDGRERTSRGYRQKK